MFGKGKKPGSEEHVWVRQVATVDPKAEALLAWRIQYDQERDEAFAAGRSCGKCIDGIVRFGAKEDDQAPCAFGSEVCKFAKQASSEQAAS